MLSETRKFGSAIARRMRSTPFAADEMESLPPKHAARVNQSLCIERNVYEPVTLPLRWTCANPVEVIFDGAMPVAPTPVPEAMPVAPQLRWVDLNKAVRDPRNPNILAPKYSGPDRLHPSPAGYRKMAETVDLTKLS